MIKKILSMAFMCAAFIAHSQSFTLTYPFSAVTPSTGLIDPTPTPTAAGITSGSFTAVGTPSANPNASGRFSFVGWPLGATSGVDTYSTMTGAINTGEYYEIVLTPVNGYTIALNSIIFTVQRSAAGIRNYAVRTSADGFTNNLPASVTTNTNLSVVGTNEFFWNLDALSSAQNGSTISLFGATITSSVSFRFYGWNAEQSGGTFSIDNVNIDGVATGSALPCASPTISAITGNSPICDNQTLNLGSSVLGDAPFTYTWTGAGTIGSPNASSTTITGATSSDYTLTVSNACGTATAVATATVNAAPTISVNSATICAGNSATLTATGTSSSYVWNTAETTASIVVTPTTSPVSFTVMGTSTNSCSATAIATVIVNALPSVSVNSASICAGNSATLTATGAVSYAWNTGQSTTSIIVTPTTSPVDYTVTGTDANNCSNTAIATVTVNAVPNVSLTLNPDLHCVTVNTVTLAGGSPSGGVYSGPGVTGGVFSPATVGVGTYTIMYSYTDGNNCFADAVDIMTVNACTGFQTLNADVVSIYPNPTNGLVVVKTPALNAQVSVFDVNGKNVFTQTTTSFETQMDLSHLANGVYQLNIVSDNQLFNYKVMINK